MENLVYRASKHFDELEAWKDEILLKLLGQRHFGPEATDFIKRKFDAWISQHFLADDAGIEDNTLARTFMTDFPCRGSWGD